ncbi:MAG: anti-sigma regulatory factor [Symploca sp. SIO2B6]|nr:anti-sigma regulatory factor [Symploca sp. SIO2B6]
MNLETLKVTGTLNSLAVISKYIKTVCKTAKLDHYTAYKLRLAVDEIATNIIIHGYESSGIKGDLVFQFQIDQQALTISIEDTGILYNPLEQETPNDLEKPLEERKIGGLGIYLAIQSVDQFLYERKGNINRNILVINR